MHPCESHMEPKGPCENHMDPSQKVHGPGTWSTWRRISIEAPYLPNSECNIGLLKFLILYINSFFFL